MAIEQRIVKRTLDLLLGKDVEVKDGSPLEPSDDIVVGSYTDGDGNTNGVIMMDISFACYSAAALSMLPADIAQDCIKSGSVDEPIRSNLHEVLNVGVGFFSDGSTPDMRLDNMYMSGDEIPDNVKDVISNAFFDLSIEVDIPGYGSGCSTLLKS